ncbi:Chaoptin [Blattella germanica]|nr:Chaoptin [Blattella germanica]
MDLLKLGLCLVVLDVARAAPSNSDTVQYPPCIFNPLCSCSKSVPDFGLVFCRNVPLPRLPPPINSSKVFMLHMENNGLRSVEPYFLQGTGLYRLEISRNPLPGIPDEAFMGLERSLWELELQYNDLSIVPSRAMRHLQKLRLLDLTGNDISEVSAENWRGLENSLQTLILSDNALSSLAPNTFSSLLVLETLDLRGNHIGHLETDLFRAGPPRLMRLILADNQLTSVPYQQLAPLKGLRTLDLGFNMIERLHNSGADSPGSIMSLDTLRLDYNQIEHLPTGAFQHFDILNRTDAFKEARMRELSLRSCGLTELSQGAFGGLEPTLQSLDLSANNLTDFPRHLFHEFDFLRTLTLRDNKLPSISPADTHNGFQYSVYRLDMSGPKMGITSLQDLRSRLSQPNLSPEDFLEFGVDLEELRVINGGLKTIKNHAFRHVRGVRTLDFSENEITQMETEAFSEIGHSLQTLKVSHGFASSVSNIPAESLRPLVSLQHLDFSNNRIRSMPETSFHFLKRLKVLELQDNQIDVGTLSSFRLNVSHNTLQRLEHNSTTGRMGEVSTLYSNVKVLDFSYNNVSYIGRTYFRPVERSLTHLYMSHNWVRNATRDVFGNMPHLQWLDLSYNQLAEMDFDTFRNTRNLQVQVRVEDSTFSSLNRLSFLDLSHNPELVLETRGRSFKGLEDSLLQLNLRNDSLNEVPELPLHALRTLRISHNEIEDIPNELPTNLTSLRRLDISHNQFQTVPPAIRSLPQLRFLELESNPITTLSSVSFQGAMEELEELDLRHLPLNYFEPNTLNMMNTLQTLKLSPYKEVRDFNIPQIIQQNHGLRDLHLEAFEKQDLEEEFSGSLPFKVRNITISGGGISNVPNNLFKGVRSPRLHFTLRNTSVEMLPRTLFQQTNWIRNLSLDIRNNSLFSIGNPNTGEFPGAPKSMFLKEMQLTGNRWTCDLRQQQRECHEISAEEDDLRQAKCDNRNNASFLETLKTEVECGWGSGAPVIAPSWVLGLAIVIGTFLPSGY